ncbi:MAG: Gfo/Idh/MocA family oxidoreductase [Erysipelotrichaceae bacterium]|nr:Gfo/Idh/MocA family oxidoreductase [Erysipelotrichaceae bacterium]
MKIATIGTSFITEWFLSAAAKIDNAEPIAVYSRNEQKGKDLASQYGIQKVYTDLDAMLKDDEIECVYVASPNSLHYQHASAALKAGKHVICEKPFTSTAKELKELSELAKSKHLFLFEAIVTIHMPNYISLKEKLPELGDIKMVQCNFSQYSSRYDKFMAGESVNVFDPKFSGGALMDINIYNLHFVMNLFGKPNDVHYYPNMTRGIDTSGVLVLNYEGFHAVCVGCKDTKSHNISQIQGEKGYITLNSETSRCANYSLTTNDGTVLPAIKQEDIALYYEIKDFMRIMEEQDYAACEALLEYSNEVMEVLEQARKKAGIRFPADANE